MHLLVDNYLFSDLIFLFKQCFRIKSRRRRAFVFKCRFIYLPHQVSVGFSVLGSCKTIFVAHVDCSANFLKQNFMLFLNSEVLREKTQL